MRDTLTEAGLCAQRKMAILGAKEADFLHANPSTPRESIESEAPTLAIVRDAETTALLSGSWLRGNRVGQAWKSDLEFS